MVSYFINWASDPANSTLVRTLVAIAAIPGAAWGCYLFWRWLRGRSLDQQVDILRHQNEEVHYVMQGLITKLDFDPKKRVELDNRISLSGINPTEPIIRKAVDIAIDFTRRNGKEEFTQIVDEYMQSFVESFEKESKVLTEKAVREIEAELGLSKQSSRAPQSN